MALDEAIPNPVIQRKLGERKMLPACVVADGGHKTTALKKLFLDVLVKRFMETSCHIFKIEVSCWKKTFNVLISLIDGFQLSLRAKLTTFHIKSMDSIDSLTAGLDIFKS